MPRLDAAAGVLVEQRELLEQFSSGCTNDGLDVGYGAVERHEQRQVDLGWWHRRDRDVPGRGGPTWRGSFYICMFSPARRWIGLHARLVGR